MAKKNMKNDKYVSCDHGSGDEAAWLGADVALGQVGRMFGKFLTRVFFRGAVHSSRLLSADPLALPNF